MMHRTFGSAASISGWNPATRARMRGLGDWVFDRY